MVTQERERLSKLLSFVLRHRPERYGVRLDAGGWVDVGELVTALASRGVVVSGADVLEVVQSSEKRRFALSEDGARIRANQGHSRPVDLGYLPERPPETLFHGTVGRALEGIRSRGLERGRRLHVHLSASVSEAERVGQRRGAPVVLEVRADEMAAAGHLFFRAPNGVWLTEAVPSTFIRFPS